MGIGVFLGNYYVIFAGRVIQSFGGENILNVQMVCIEKWFGGKMISIAMGMAMFFSYSGTIANNYFTPYLILTLNDPFKAMMVVMFILSFFTLTSFAYVMIEMKYNFIFSKSNLNDNIVNEIFNEESKIKKENSSNGFRDIFKLNSNYYILVIGFGT